jgi:hypothetical protein
MSTEQTTPAEAPKKSKKMLMIIVIAAVVLLGGGAGAFFMLKGDSAEAAAPEKGAVTGIDDALTINLADGHYPGDREGPRAPQGRAPGEDRQGLHRRGQAGSHGHLLHGLRHPVTLLHPGGSTAKWTRPKRDKRAKKALRLSRS